MKQNSYILWLLPDEQLYFGRFGEPFWLVGYPLILPQQEYEDSENHKARLSVHASVKNLRPQITNLWRSGHFDSFIPFSKMQQLGAKLWRQKTLKTKRLYQPKARRHSCGNYRARGCPLWAWVLCHLGLSPNWRCPTGGQQMWVLALTPGAPQRPGSKPKISCPHICRWQSGLWGRQASEDGTDHQQAGASQIK